MREGWREVKLSELVDNHIVELKRGKIIAKTLLSDDKEYPVYSASAQGNGLLGYSDTYDLDEELISWSVDGGGRPFYREKHKFSVTNVCGYLRILDTSVLDYRFLYYCMRSEWQKNKFDYSHKAHPSVIKELYKILIPPLDEQKKIAKVLSDLENLENIHSAKADVLSRMKEHLMDNKSGIIEKERNRSVFDADLIRLQDEIKKNIHIDFDRLNSTNLDAQIKFYKDNVDKIVHTIRVITYIGEDKQYERERESLTPDIEWRTVKLRDIIKITSGEFIKKDLQNPNGQYKVYNGGTSHTGCYDKFNVEGPKVIISSRGTAGFVNRVFENFWAGNSCYVLNILDETELDFDFLYYILKSNQEKLQGQTQSGTIPAINMGQVYDLDINIPVKISEQKRIAKVLSDLDRLQELHGLKVNKLYKMKEHLMDNKSGIIEKERNRSNIDSRILELSSKLGLKFNDTSLNDINTKIKIHKESLDKINYRIEVITYVGENKQYERERESLTQGTPWVTSKLGDLCTIKTGKLNANAAVEDGEYPFFTCSKQDYKIDRHSFNGEALLISGNGDVGNVKYYKGKFDAYQRTYVLMDFKLDARYLYYYLKESMPKRAREMLNGSAVPYIKLNCITDMDVAYPQDIEEQKKIANIFSDLDELANLHSLKVNELTKMKESLMNNKSGIVERKKNKQESNEWITVSLKDICNFTKGKNPQEYNEDGLGKPIVSAPEIGSILGNCTYSKFTDEDLPDCVKDDILLLWDGSRAGISGFNHEAILSSTIMRLRVKDKDSFYPKLIYYMLVVNKDKISSNRTGSAIPHLNRQVVEDLIFELPRNIEEQKRIADILSQYDKMIDTQEELISIIQRERVYTSNSSDNHSTSKWKTVRLGELVEICDNKRKPVTKSDRTSGEYPYYGGGGIQDYVDSYIFDGDYILLGEDGAPFFDKSRRVAFSVHNKFWANNHIHVLKTKENVDQDYLAYYLNTINYELYVSNGVVPKLNQSSMRSIEIEIPESVEEQRRIASILKDYDKMINSQEKLIELIQRERERVYSRSFSDNPQNYKWRTVKLGDIVKINSGKGIKKSEYIEGGKYPIIGANGEIGRTDRVNNTKKVLTTGRVGTIGTIQKVEYAWITDNSLIIDIKDTSETDIDYLYHILGLVDFKSITTGNAQPLVTSTRLKEIEVSLPDIEEQRRISQVFDSFDNMIERNKDLIDIVNEERESIQGKLLGQY